MTNHTYNAEKAAKAQREYAGELLFAPSGGVCYRCGKNIYRNYDTTGISVEEAGSHLITGCPHCHYSFVE